MKWLKSGLILVLLYLVTSKAAPVPAAEADPELRLPETSRPISYEIEITTSVDKDGERAFSGIVKIEVEILQDTSVLVLHNHGLTIQENDVKFSLNGLESPVTVSHEIEKDFLIITSTSLVMSPSETAILEIPFEGLLRLDRSGFYRSSYRVGSEVRYLAVTQFQEFFARAAFPCYDEPGYKAEFKLTINHGAAYKAVSNTRGTTTDNIDGTKKTTFEKTPIMSSYLIAFFISDFESIDNSDTRIAGKPLHTFFVRPEEIARIRDAMDISIMFLQELEKYTGYDYVLPDMFSAAIPDIDSWAMENWGMTFFKEQVAILSDDPHPREVFDSLRIIANQMGHQFFGNVVTCKWWDYLWMNEGFGAFFEYFLIERVLPQFRPMHMLNIQKLQNGFLLDNEEAHPMTFAGDYIYGMYYDKTVSVLRMFQHTVGEDLFQEALSIYLKNNEYGSVTSDNLFQAFDTVMLQREFNDFNFKSAFNTWEVQLGYPLVHISADDIFKSFKVTQLRYYKAVEDKFVDDGRKWFIPLNFATASDPDFLDTKATSYFRTTESELNIPFDQGFDDSQWFIFNKQQIGYYRVNYDEKNWNALIKVLNSTDFEKIHVLNRAQLIDDAMNLAADGYIRYQTAIQLLSYLHRETDYIPWKAALNNIEKLDNLMKCKEGYEFFQKFIKQLVRRMYVVRGFDETMGDTLTDKFGRELAIDLTCSMGDENCLAVTYERLRKMTIEGQQYPASVEISYICNGLKGLKRQWEFVSLMNRMQNSNDQSERLRLIDGMVCTTDPELVKYLLDSIIDNPEISYRAHERTRIINSIYMKSPGGMKGLVELLSERYDEFVEIFSESYVDRVILALSKRVTTDDEKNLLDTLINNLSGKIRSTTLETVDKNIEENKLLINYQRFLNVIVGVGEYFQAEEAIENQLRLPKFQVPQLYKIHITAPEIPSGSLFFTGQIEIDLLVKESTSYVIFHSKSQIIKDLQVSYKSDGRPAPVLDYHLYPDADTLTIYFMEDLPANTELIIVINYSGTMLLASDGFAFYQTSYVIDGETRYLGATNCESSVSSRFIYPHFDEPWFKTQFELTITHSSSHNAISNTFGTAVTNTDGTITTSFVRTPIMPSYLLAFVISDLGYISNENTKQENETLHRVWVRPDSTANAKYALDHSVLVLKALENYVNYVYELPKMDSAGVPLKSGAMENWGMVTYRENAMIYDLNADNIPHTQKISGVDVISHELAHQFFGDVVTCEWWDYIWLNEGFATLFEYHLTSILYPEWRMRDFFNIRTLQATFRTDSRDATRPMTTSLLTRAEIRAAFDGIAYGKSGTVLRMFQNVVGEDIFRESLNLYLKTNHYKPVNSQHLVDAFKATMLAKGFTDFDFDVAFRSWELQKGYPMIHVSYADRKFVITQERFFTDKKEFSNDTSSWYIPINYATASNPRFDDTHMTNYFVNGQDLLMVDVPAQFDASQWFVFNKQQLSYYRVNYDTANWNALIKALNSDEYNKIHELNRAQLVDDTISFASGGYLDYDTTIGIMNYLRRETEYAPWAAADRLIQQLYTTFGLTNEDLNTFVRILSAKFYATFKVPSNLAIPAEGIYERYSRELAMKLACYAENEDCLQDTYRLNQMVADTTMYVPKGLESVVFCSGFRGVDKQDVWVKLWKKMQDDASLKSLLLAGLGCSDDPVVLKDYLESTLGSGNSVSYTAAERRSVIAAVLNSYSGFEVVINFYKDFELDIMSFHGYTSLETMISVAARAVRTRAQQAMFTDYLATLSHLDSEAFRRVTKIVSDNFLNQQNADNTKIMSLIRGLLVDETTTPEPPTSTTPTTTPPSSTASNTTPSTSTTSTTTPSTSTNPTTMPTTTTTSTPPTVPTPAGTTPVSTTTLGASSIGIKVMTVIACLAIIMFMRKST